MRKQRRIILKSYELLYKCLLSSVRLMCRCKMPHGVAVFVCFILQRPILKARQMTGEYILVAKYLPKVKSILFFLPHFFFFFFLQQFTSKLSRGSKECPFIPVALPGSVMPAIGQTLSCCRNPCWFMWPITQPIITPQTLLLSHYLKVSHRKHPVPDLPSQGEFLPWKKQVLSLQHLHLLSQVMQDPTPDASRPSRALDTAFHCLWGKGVDDSRSLFPPSF